MPGILGVYAKKLHTRWPAGVVEKLPRIGEDGSTNVPGVYIVGDLTGIPLLKFSADSGARAVQTILEDQNFEKLRVDRTEEDALDLVVIGAGVSGMAAALEAKNVGLSYVVLEASEPFSTVLNFPKAKPIYAYPTQMQPTGGMQFNAKVKEPLIEELIEQTLEEGVQWRHARAEKVERKGKYLNVVIPDSESLVTRRVIIAIGRSGNFRKLGIPGEQLDKVYNRLHDPKDFCEKKILVVGGGDSALETTIALAQCGAHVVHVYRGKELSRPKPENIDRFYQLVRDPMADVAVEQPVSERVTTSAGGFLGPHRRAGSIRLMLEAKPVSISPTNVVVADADGKQHELANDAVFSMIGREAPLEFFRRSKIHIHGESRTQGWTLVVIFLLISAWLYNWKSGGYLGERFAPDPVTINEAIQSLSGSDASNIADRTTILGTISVSMTKPAFWFTSLYTLLIGVFGYRRIRRRKTPYVKVQTLVLILVQLFPLFLLPEIFLPWLGYNGFFESGILSSIANALFPLTQASDSVWPPLSHPREYWRAYGLILAWPLNVYNVFTDDPMFVWLAVSFVQTFVFIPAVIYFFGKGAYCGWICSCGALAETMGDGQRRKMFHGPFWNRLNMLGQAILWIAFGLLLMRIWGWIDRESWANQSFNYLLKDSLFSYKWVVDVGLAGVLGVGFYFKYSGRLWCRFACPLAALMHIYARFSRFRILSEKSKCISCNECTSVCHQGIDVMNFANKGLPMEDPECVRCSACVEHCPTGTLRFGSVNPRTGEILGYDKLAASPVLMRESQ